jgi:hypothetical protein
VGRGIRLFRYLSQAANRGHTFGVSYVGFIEYLHGVKFADLLRRNYLPSDSKIVVRVALGGSRRQAGRRSVRHLDPHRYGHVYLEQAKSI